MSRMAMIDVKALNVYSYCNEYNNEKQLGILGISMSDEVMLKIYIILKKYRL